MRALVAHEARGALGIETLADPSCTDNGAVVKLHACGVCRSDHHAWVGVDPDVTFPHVMGHELAGEVVVTGKNCNIPVGTRVTAPFILGCGTCGDCTSGNATICETQSVIGFNIQGAFAEYISISNAAFNLVTLPDALDYDVAAGMGCRVTTAYRAVVERGALHEGEWIAIFGAGGVGLSAVLIAKALGAQVIAVDISDDARKLAKSFGADLCLNPKDTDIPTAIRDHTNGGAHLGIEALGKTVTYQMSLLSLRKLGRYVQVGMPTGKDANPALPLLDLVYSRQLSLHGTRGIAPSGFAGLLEMIERKSMPIEKLVTDRINLCGVEAVLKSMDGVQPAGISVVTEF